MEVSPNYVQENPKLHTPHYVLTCRVCWNHPNYVEVNPNYGEDKPNSVEVR